MAENLIIVESPAKVRTIKKFLGTDFEVKASMGHVKDLPEKQLGVDIEKDFRPTYIVIPEKKKALAELKKSANKSKKIFLATDPDREGEAIAWHISEEIKNQKIDIWRATFNEITKTAVLNAINNPHPLNENMFNAQQARRILDRLVGYKISPLLWMRVKRGLSAGRVQSVALRLICEREKAISDFIPKEYWTVDVLLEKDGNSFWARLQKFRGKKIEINNQEEAERVAMELKKCRFVIADVQKKEKKKNPPPPFITSFLQQDASKRLNYPPKRTMMIAQKLYEGVEIGEVGPVALITYMRTDSFRIAEEAINAVRQFIAGRFGKLHLPDLPNRFKSRRTAQEAHEAIRPVSMEYEPAELKKYLKKDESALYELIWNRFVASQMKPAVYDQTLIDINAGEYLLRASGSLLKFDGFLAVYSEIMEEKEEADDEEKEVRFPELKVGEVVDHVDTKKNQHFTQPPPRYSEATLIKELEEKGIGRPSTYASIVGTIQERNYVEKHKGKLVPTPLGYSVNELLIDNFPEIVNIKFTADMEEGLDRIEEGKIEWLSLLRDFYNSFKVSLESATRKMKSLKSEGIKTDIICDKCGGTMVIRWGKNGEFLACSNYPACRNTSNFKTVEGGRIVAVVKEQKYSDIDCDKCGSKMIIKTGKGGARFLACERYPDCKNIKPFSTGVKCPECGGDIVERRGKRGAPFYGCSGYPECKFTLNYLPVPAECPECKHPFLVREKEGERLKCPNKECGYRE